MGIGIWGSGAREWVGVLRWMLLPDCRLELGDQVTGSLMRSRIRWELGANEVYGGLRGQVRRQLRSM
jgi:hypothetical protein